MRSRIIILCTTICLILPITTSAKSLSEVQKIEQEIAIVREKAEEARKKSEENERYISLLNREKQSAEAEVQTLSVQIDETSKKLEELQGEIDTTNAEIQVTAMELKETTDKINERDKLMRSRTVHLYMNGSVSYLEVLLQSASFSDFLERFDAVVTIIQSDRDIIKQNEEDKEVLEKRKELVQAQLDNVNTLYKQSEALKNSLATQQGEKEEHIHELDEQVGHLEEISAEQEQALIELARAEIELQKKKREAEKKAEEIFYNGGKLRYPLPKTYRVSSQFGYRTHPVTGEKQSFHAGTDYAAPDGTDILAAEGGSVIVAGSNGGYGNCIIINHGNGLWTVYGHIRPGGIKVEVGETVKRGQKIGEVGTTGRSTGYHLHFEVRLNEKAVNPSDYLK